MNTPKRDVHTIEYYSTTTNRIKTDAWYNMDKLWKHCAKWEKKIQKTATYCMIPFISSVQNKQTHRDRKEEEIRRDFLLGWGKSLGFMSLEVMREFWTRDRLKCH